MKKISIVIPCLNEEKNVLTIALEIKKVFSEKIFQYNYEIIFIDNDSVDETRKNIRQLCTKDKRIKAIFNSRNFGPSRSPVYGLMQSNGECAILIPADLQVPPELIPEFLEKWEKGYRIVVAKKSKSKENPVMFLCRKIYYKIFDLIGDGIHIEHFAGFGLYDRKFIDILRTVDEPEPYIRGMVTEFEGKWGEVEYTEPRREDGRSKTNFFSLYDTAMLGFTSYSKAIPRYATFIGFLTSGICILASVCFFILKLLFWNSYPMGIAPILISIFLLGGIQLFFIGLIGEYIIRINTRVGNRPLVIEEERINF